MIILLDCRRQSIAPADEKKYAVIKNKSAIVID